LLKIAYETKINSPLMLRKTYVVKSIENDHTNLGNNRRKDWTSTHFVSN